MTIQLWGEKLIEKAGGGKGALGGVVQKAGETGRSLGGLKKPSHNSMTGKERVEGRAQPRCRKETGKILQHENKNSGRGHNFERGRHWVRSSGLGGNWSHRGVECFARGVREKN